MLYFTKYAESKFDILNKHQIYFTREQIEDTINVPDKTGKKGRLFTAEKDGVKTVFKKDGELIKIITFYPINRV